MSSARAADLIETQTFYSSGEYEKCAAAAGKAINDGEFSEEWRIVKLQAELATGRYGDAVETLKAALERYPTSIRLRWLGADAYRYNGDSQSAIKLLDEIQELVAGSSYRYRDPANRLIVGRFFLLRGADPKQVLDEIYNKTKQDYPDLPGAFIASGDLALDKHDFGLAAEAFEKAVKLDAENADVHCGLARAYGASDSEKAEAALKTALLKNPNHVPSLLLIVDEHIDAERYDEAKKTIERILAVNPKQPLAWAYRAVIAHLANKPDRERECRTQALASWTDNPEVDHLIGRKLSQKYRFAEGEAYQRRALQFDSNYLPAKAQLCQDLLRLGKELEGWKLADEVFGKDNYDVVAHNLTTLRDRLTKFRTLEGNGFVVRMEEREAKIYGDRVLDLLRRARKHLCAKYEVELPEPVFVEIFARQQDFAIRTFGMPGGAGFLGVCFGRVITMNSPASQGDTPSNWEAVLWHEFCHVVTLNKTNNKMPRWLSEGISVYEEGQKRKAWGEQMNPKYREMILEDQLTPVSQLSGAFLDPKSPLHLQFAYFESSLVVQYIVEKYGLETLKRILVDLSVGMPINDSIQRYAGSLEVLDREFADYARDLAANLAPKASFDKPELPLGADAAALAKWNEEHPDSFWGLRQYAARLMADKQWQQAKKPLQRLVEIYPDYGGPDSAYLMLSLVHRELGETDAERAVLKKLAELDADAVPVYLRLMEIDSAAKDWPATLAAAEAALSVNPLVKAPHRYLADAAEKTGDDARALKGLSALLEMDPFDPAEAHLRVASLLHRTGKAAEARRHVLQSLEEAPRFREAHKLLLQIVAEKEQAEAEASKQPPMPPMPEPSEGKKGPPKPENETPLKPESDTKAPPMPEAPPSPPAGAKPKAAPPASPASPKKAAPTPQEPAAPDSPTPKTEGSP